MFLKRLNLFKKFFIFTFGVVFITLIVGLLFNYLFFDKFYIHQKKNNILKIRNEVLKNINNPELMKKNIEYYNDCSGEKIEIVPINIDPHSLRHQLSKKRINRIVKYLKAKKSLFFIKEFDNNSGVLFIIYAEKLDNNNILIIRSSLGIMSQHIHDMWIFNIFIAIISIIISSLLGLISSKKLVKNIEYLRLKAEKIARLEFPNQILLNTGDELQELSESLNTMSNELLHSIENLKSFVSNASHELKTPISVLCLYSQALVLNKVKEENKKEHYKILLKKSLEMKELTQSLLLLSKLKSIDYKLKRENINLKKLIINSCEEFDYLELSKDLELSLSLEEIYIIGDFTLIKSVIRNLIQNMFKYSIENSSVFITLTDKTIIFKNFVEQDIDCDKLLEPFSRGENATNNQIEGSGLGLSLVNTILSLHKLNFNIECSNNIFEFTIFL